MNRDRFWEYIERTRGSDPEQLERSLRELLSPLSTIELASFQRHFDELADEAYTWDVCGAACQLNMDGDDFLDFRCTLIAHGRRVYEAAVRDPDGRGGSIQPD